MAQTTVSQAQIDAEVLRVAKKNVLARLRNKADQAAEKKKQEEALKAIAKQEAKEVAERKAYLAALPAKCLTILDGSILKSLEKIDKLGYVPKDLKAKLLTSYQLKSWIGDDK